MATDRNVFDESFSAENDLSAKQFYAVELSAANQVDVCDALDDLVIGVLQNKPEANQAAQVRMLGITRWVSDGSSTAIAAGDYVRTDASGKAVKCPTATEEHNRAAGIALSASSADGTIIDVFLTPGVMVTSA